MKYRAFLIDPFEKEVKEVRGEWGVPQEVYKIVGSPDIGTLPLLPKIDDMHDAMGVYRRGQQWFKMGNFPLPMAGKHLLIGMDREEGKTIDIPVFNPNTIGQSITWLIPELAHAQFPRAKTINKDMGLVQEALPPEAFESLPMPDIDMLLGGSRG